MEHCPRCRRETPTLTGHDAEHYAATFEVLVVRTCEACGAVKGATSPTRSNAEGYQSYPKAPSMLTMVALSLAS